MECNLLLQLRAPGANKVFNKMKMYHQFFGSMRNACAGRFHGQWHIYPSLSTQKPAIGLESARNEPAVTLA
jgi:hypothetical protein